MPFGAYLHRRLDQFAWNFSKIFHAIANFAALDSLESTLYDRDDDINIPASMGQSQLTLKYNLY